MVVLVITQHQDRVAAFLLSIVKSVLMSGHMHNGWRVEVFCFMHSSTFFPPDFATSHEMHSCKKKKKINIMLRFI